MTTREAERGYGIFLPLHSAIGIWRCARSLLLPPSLRSRCRPQPLARSLCAFFTPGRAGLKLGGKQGAAAAVRSDKHYFCITAGLSSGFLNETFHIQLAVDGDQGVGIDHPAVWEEANKEGLRRILPRRAKFFFAVRRRRRRGEAKMKGGERLRSR